MHKFVCVAICSPMRLDNPYGTQIQTLAKNQSHYERKPAPFHKQCNFWHHVTLKLCTWETNHYTALHTCKYALCWNYHWRFPRLFGRQLMYDDHQKTAIGINSWQILIQDRIPP